MSEPTSRGDPEDEADLAAALASKAEPGEGIPMDVLFGELGLEEFGEP